MTTVTIYRSTDASAPVLTGSAGALIAVLSACLVNGYTGKAAAGWTLAFSGTNQAAYRNSTVDGTGFYLNVDDSGPGAGGAREARMTGFQAMTAVMTGTGQFPTSGQLAIGIGATVCRKSATADTVARAWTLVADDTCFYLFTESGDFTSPIGVYSFVFGDIFSYKASDAYRSIIIGRNIENNNSCAYEPLTALLSMNQNATFLSNTIIGHYMAASWTGVGGSILVGKHVDQTKMSGYQGAAQGGYSGTASLGGSSANIAIGRNSNNSSLFSYPNGPDGGLYLSPIWIHHNNAVRGYLKGLWAPLHDRPLNHDDTFSGTGNMAGKSFVVQSALAYIYGNDYGQVHIETSSTWS